MISIAIGVESVMRLFQPTTVAFEEATIIAIVGLGVNMASAFLLSGNHHHHGDDEHHHAHHGNDNNMRSAYVNVLADALTDRKSAVSGKSVSVGIDTVGRRINKKKQNK